MASACSLSMSEAVNARAMARGSNMAPLLGVGRCECVRRTGAFYRFRTGSILSLP